MAFRLASLAERLALDTRVATIAPARSGRRGKTDAFPQCPRGCWAEPACASPKNPISLCRDACVLGAAERAGNTLYGARVYLELGRRLAHTHAARQGRPDTLRHLIRDRRTAKSLTFTLGPL